MVNILKNNGWNKPKPHYNTNDDIKVLDEQFAQTTEPSPETKRKLKQLMHDLRSNNVLTYEPSLPQNKLTNSIKNDNNNYYDAQKNLGFLPFIFGGLLLCKYDKKCCKCHTKKQSLQNIKKLNDELKID